MSLADVARILVPQRIVDESLSAIRQAAAADDELFLFWSGTLRDRELQIEHVLCPPQRCVHSEDGMGVVISGEALHQQSVWLAAHGQTLGVQLHAHPDDAYHSDSDDRHAVVTRTGALSVVLAQFGQSSLIAPATRVYRLERSGWRRITPAQWSSILQVVG